MSDKTETKEKEVAEKSEPAANITIMPPKFMAQQKVVETPQQEYESVLKEIEEAQQKGKSVVIIKHDLRDLAWQKLSQAGYKLKRTVMPRLVKDKNSTIGELDPNRVEFEISLTEFNRPYNK